MDEKSHSEYVREELARQFYKAISTAAGSGHGRVTIDFTNVRPKWDIQFPQIVGILDESDPPVIDMLDLIEKMVPGLWGYAENAGARKLEVCTRCHKTFDKKTHQEISR